MAKPVVTCGPDQILTYSGVAQTINLTAVATESPSQYQWDMLSVPTGSSAKSGTNGDFTNGQSTLQNPSFDVDASVDGMYVCRCIAYNGEWSDPDSDRQSGQTLILVRSNKLQVWYVNDGAWLWGQLYLTPTLREFEDKGIFITASGEIHAITAKANPVAADEILAEDSEASWVKKRIAISALPYNSLGSAYNQGGAGAGNTITTVGGNPVKIQNTDGSTPTLKLENLSGLDGEEGSLFIEIQAGTDGEGALKLRVDADGNNDVHALIGEVNTASALAAADVLSGIKMSSPNLNAGNDATSEIRHYEAKFPMGGNAAQKVGFREEYSDVAFKSNHGETHLDGGPIRFGQQGSDPSTVTDKGFLYVKNVGGVAELFYRDDTNAAIQLTTGGALNENFSPGTPIQLNEQGSDPAQSSDKGHLYTKDVGGVTELFYQDDTNAALQVTEAGALKGAGGGGFTAYEEEFTASAGSNEFSLAATPAANVNTLSGRNILGVFRNGVRSRYVASPTLANEYNQSGGNDKLNVVAQVGGEIITVVYGV